MSEEPSALALRLIESRKTMVLATAGAGAWAAPVYYLYRDECFWFFSSPKSRHVTEALAAGECAAAIFQESDDWHEIEGLQMDGSIEESDPREDLFREYLLRFPTAGDLAGSSLAGFQEKLRARLYRFVPRRRFYLNNRRGFGRRVEL